MNKGKSLPRYVQVAIDICRLVLNGEIKEDSLIKGRTDLAGKYRVSPETVRKAMFLLEEEGVVLNRPGVGIFIKDVISAETFITKFKGDRSIRVRENEFKELLQQRNEAEEKLQQCMIDMVDAFKYRTSEAINFYEVELLPESRLVGQTIGEMKFWANTGATIVAVVHDDAITVSPGPDMPLQGGDILIVVGDEDVIARCEKFMDEGIAAEVMAKHA